MTQLPDTVGIGFKRSHYEDLRSTPNELGFIAVHGENYMGDGGPPHAQLAMLRDRYALSIHGVGLSIGSSGPLDRDHLARMKRLCDRYAPESCSEYLAWSSHGGAFLNDLLPLT